MSRREVIARALREANTKHHVADDWLTCFCSAPFTNAPALLRHIDESGADAVLAALSEELEPAALSPDTEWEQCGWENEVGELEPMGRSDDFYAVSPLHVAVFRRRPEVTS